MISFLLPIIYLSFISLGLPDGLLGSAWPTMSVELGVPVSFAGILSTTMSLGTILSSLFSDRLTRYFGTGRVTAYSVAMTAMALLGFSVTKNFWLLFIWAIPYGLGAGSVDASLNNYVAIHYESRHMSWLHCMWGVGATVGPYIMGYALTAGQGWNMGYRYIAMLQMILTAVLLLTLPKWNAQETDTPKAETPARKALSLSQTIAIPGVKEVMLAFFCYCALEGTAMLWGSTYLVGKLGMDAQRAASLGAMFFIGITVGRFLSGFMTMLLEDRRMIRLGHGVIAIGICLMLLSSGKGGAIVGLLMIGFGCAPIYPCLIHSTPAYFGEENSQAVIGVQVACAYLGCLSMPPLFGVLVDCISVSVMPLYMGVILIVMVAMCEQLNRKTKKK